MGLLQASFSMNLPITVALSRSRRFRSSVNAPPPVLYACQPTINSLAIFFRLSDRTLECVLEDDQEKAETIYQACEQTVREVLLRFKNNGDGAQLQGLYLEEDNGRRTDISAKVLTPWESLRGKLELRDWGFRVVNSLLLVGAAFKLTGLLTAVYVGLISFAAMLITSTVQSFLEVRSKKLRWRVG